MDKFTRNPPALAVGRFKKRYSSPRVKHMAMMQRAVDRVLTMLEDTTETKCIVMMGWLAEAVHAAGYKVFRRNYCASGLYWYTVSWKK